MLSYLHLCADSGVVVVDYVDHAVGSMQQSQDGGGRFTEAILQPRVTVSEESMTHAARELHGPAHQLCFIANSVSFPVRHDPTIEVA
jgi:organic hydroperoxide reductase OsmC/OhrA